ncbi:MAG: proton-conducting transporter membrane subunit, partial [Anaerolineae bacterium]|nr:hypothetical protein [Thermoflexales bacterium]MDW8406271.1 proton-conducting transporter membrane subunit [Anaerolineae bacterium]
AFKQQFDWFRGNAPARDVIHACGLAILLLSGALAWAQRSWGRLLACAIGVDLGAMLLMLNFETPAAIEALAFGIAARVLSLGVFAAGLSALRTCAASDDFERTRGAGRSCPAAVLAIALGALSIAGLPGTVGFVTRWLNTRVLSVVDLEMLVVVLLAGVSVGWGSIRGVFNLLAEAPPSGEGDTHPLRPTPVSAPAAISRTATLTLVVSSAVLVVLGLAPAPLAELAKAVASAYTFFYP